MYRLTTMVTPVGSGSIEGGNQLYPKGQLVFVLISCDLGREFLGWDGNLPSGVDRDSKGIMVKMDRNRDLLAPCAETVPPTSTPPPPEPTDAPPGFTLTINGFPLNEGDTTFEVGNGFILLSEPVGVGGTYPRNTLLTLEAWSSDNAIFTWTGVDSVDSKDGKDGNVAIVEMNRARNVGVEITPSAVQKPQPDFG